MTTLAFDIDGTIFDCGAIVAQAFAEGARIFGANAGIALPEYSSDDIMRVVGFPTQEIFRILYPELNILQRQELMRKSQEQLARMVREGGGTLIEGVPSTIRLLSQKGYRLCAASNGTREYIEAILETHHLASFFMPLVVLNGTWKTKSDIVKQYMKKAPADEHFIMIGDRISDIEAARDNGIPFIGCAFGHMGSAEIEHERWVAHRFDESPALICDIEKTIF